MITHILASTVQVGNKIHLHGRDQLVMWVHSWPKYVEIRAKPVGSQIVQRYTFPHEKSIGLIKTDLSQFKWAYVRLDRR